MAIPIYLAMTAGEIRNTDRKPEYMAWMACHFSSYGTGLTNLPEALPERSLLILNDRTPIHGHDPNRILDILSERVTSLKAAGVLLDFEKSPCKQTDRVIEALTGLPCPLCVSCRHAGNFDLPVFLPPVPLFTPVESYLEPWNNRKIWLELSNSSAKATVTENGTIIQDWNPNKTLHFCDDTLHCHYRIEPDKDAAIFYLSRTEEDIRSLLQAAEACGVEKGVALWQEMGKDAKTAPAAPERS